MPVDAPRHALQCHHVPFLVVLSYVISVLGAYSALECAVKIPHGRRFGVWLWSAAVAMGGGSIWSMHFIAMLACHLPIPVSYEPLLTATSLAVAVAFTAVGLSIAGTGAVTGARVLGAGSISGLGIAAMHYTGMAAMRLPAVMRYDPALVSASVVIAVLAASAAFWIAFNPRGRWHRFLSALVMGAAVCGMHYTAMAAATFVPVPSAVRSSALDHGELAYMVFAVTVVVLGLLFLANQHHDRAARQIRESEARLRSILNSSLDAVVEMDSSGRITGWNPSAEAMFGWTAAQALGHTAAELVIPERYRAAHGAGLRRFDETGESAILGRRIEIEAVRAGGDEFPVELAVTAVRAGGGWNFCAFIADISARRQAQAAVRASDQRFRALIEHSSEMIVLVNREGTILYESPGATRVTGYAPEERVGRSIWDDLEPDDRAVARSLFGRCLAEPGVAFEVEMRLRRKDGGHADIEAVMVNHLPEPAIGAIVINCRDVTGRKQLENELRQAYKTEAVGRLAGGIAHDFNNLLAVILGYSELLMRSIDQPEPRRKLSEIKRAGERAAALTHQLLAFSRKQVLAPQVLDLCTVVTSTARMLQRLIGEDVELETVLHPAAGLVRVDRGQMEQVIVNLVVNARDAMPRGGKVVVAVSARNGSDPTRGPYTVLEVSDTGQGMDAETRRRIFEPFFTTKELGKGTGLGLATVHGIVQQSGGFITVDSEPGRGSTFRVHLPQVDDVAPAASADEAHDLLTGDETILLVEDEPALRRVAGETLESLGYHVLEAADGAEALRVAQRHPEPIALLLTDVVMPGLSGREVAEALCSARPGIKVLYMSGYTDDDVIRRGVLTEDVALLQKPFKVATLSRRVREVLDAR